MPAWHELGASPGMALPGDARRWPSKHVQRLVLVPSFSPSHVTWMVRAPGQKNVASQPSWELCSDAVTLSEPCVQPPAGGGAVPRSGEGASPSGAALATCGEGDADCGGGDAGVSVLPVVLVDAHAAREIASAPSRACLAAGLTATPRLTGLTGLTRRAAARSRPAAPSASTSSGASGAAAGCRPALALRAAGRAGCPCGAFGPKVVGDGDGARHDGEPGDEDQGRVAQATEHGARTLAGAAWSGRPVRGQGAARSKYGRTCLISTVRSGPSSLNSRSSAMLLGALP